MRTVLALATVLATSIVGLGTAAPAQASGCHAHVPGWDISDIQPHHGLTCDHAKQVIHHVFSTTGVHAIHWRCNEPASRSYKHFYCWSTLNNHAVGFWAVEQGATGGF